MTNKERKNRMREMLQAEGLAAGAAQDSPSWNAFKAQLRADLVVEKPPRLVIQQADKKFFRAWQLVPVFALLIFGMVFYFWRGQGVTNEPPGIALTTKPLQKTIRAMKAGDVFTHEKRSIRFGGGNANLVVENGSYLVEGSDLKADFRLKQKTDLKVEHPLLRVTVTGTEFSIDANAAGGILQLTEGSLKIELKNEVTTPLVLVAPARFEFSAKSHRIRKTASQKDRVLYRYELKNGEVFFAHLLRRTDASHQVEVLGGKTEIVSAADILRFAPVP